MKNKSKPTTKKEILLRTMPTKDVKFVDDGWEITEEFPSIQLNHINKSVCVQLSENGITVGVYGLEENGDLGNCEFERCFECEETLKSRYKKSKAKK